MKTLGLSESGATYDLIKKGLQASSKRRDVIANNMSNLNTKGYKKHYVTFEENLKECTDNLNLTTTNSRHIDTHKNSDDIEEKVDNSTSMKNDGNNVDIDNEAVNLAANTLKYNALITELNSRLFMKRIVINGGR